MPKLRADLLKERLSTVFIKRNAELFQATVDAPVADGCTTVEDVLEQLAAISTSFVRYEVVKFLQQLEEKFKLGRFISGRKTQKSRLQWLPYLLEPSAASASANRVGETRPQEERLVPNAGAEGEDDEEAGELDDADAENTEPEHHRAPPVTASAGLNPANHSVSPSKPQSAPINGPAILKHTYHLRSDFMLEVELPANFTMREAERLCTFFKSLPIE